jgi:hypothetical protein
VLAIVIGLVGYRLLFRDGLGDLLCINLMLLLIDLVGLASVLIGGVVGQFDDLICVKQVLFLTQYHKNGPAFKLMAYGPLHDEIRDVLINRREDIVK